MAMRRLKLYARVMVQEEALPRGQEGSISIITAGMMDVRPRMGAWALIVHRGGQIER
jgi:hypothetical protein